LALLLKLVSPALLAPACAGQQRSFCYNDGYEIQAVLKADNVVIKDSVTEITEVATRRQDNQMVFSFKDFYTR
jgi:hypothetical protein